MCHSDLSICLYIILTFSLPLLHSPLLALLLPLPLTTPPPFLSALQSCALQTCTPLSDNCLNCLLTISSQTVVMTGSECNADCPNITFVNKQPPPSSEGGKAEGSVWCVCVCCVVLDLSYMNTIHQVWTHSCVTLLMLVMETSAVEQGSLSPDRMRRGRLSMSRTIQ